MAAFATAGDQGGRLSLTPMSIVIVIVALSLLAIGAVAWIAAGRVGREGLRPGQSRAAVRATVVSATADEVVLIPSGRRRLKVTGTWSLWWPGGSGSISRPTAVDERAVRFKLDRAAQPPSPGTTCEFDSAPLASEGGRASSTEVTYETPLGAVTGYLVPGSGSSWLICVHGQSSSPRGTYRLLDVVAAAPAPKLAVSYRNDPGAPPAADGNFDFGRSEWADLEAGVQYAIDHGAAEIVLVAESMGASIALWFMHHSPLAARVRGIVLDAPVLDFESAVEWVGRTTGVPRPLIGLGKRAAALRFSIDWRRYDAREVLDAVEVPVLLIHGDRDGQVPVALSAEAASRNRAVVFERFAGAGHCQSWNTDRDRYESLLGDLVRRTTDIEQVDAAEPIN